MSRYQSSSILELPYELTSEIFTACLPLHRRIRPSPRQAPLQLTQVCHEWRAIALSTPDLWRCIRLEFRTHTPRRSNGAYLPTTGSKVELRNEANQRLADMLDLWLTRAAPLSLSITIIVSGGGDAPTLIIPVLAKHCTRWERIELILDPMTAVELNSIMGPFPLLKSVSFWIHRGRKLCDGPWPQLARPVNILHYARHLIALSIPDATWLHHYHGSSTSLVALYLHGHSSSEVLEDEWATWKRIFDSFPHLRHLGIEAVDSFESAIPAQSSFQCIPELESLILRGNIHVLDHLTIPTLRHLQIQFNEAHHPNHASSFITRSRCNLEHLTLTIANSLASNEQYFATERACLSTITSLTALELAFVQDSYPHEELPPARFQFFEDTSIVPHLKKLFITTRFKRQMSYDSFLSLVKLARGPRPTLIRAEFSAGSLEDSALDNPNVLAQLQQLEDNGLDLRLFVGGFSWPLWTDDGDPPGDLDYGLRQPGQMRPYYFSPFKI